MGPFSLVLLGPGAVAYTAGDGSTGRLTFVEGVLGIVVAGAVLAFGRVSGHMSTRP